MKLNVMKQCYHGVQLSDQVCADLYRTLIRFNLIKQDYHTFYVSLACKMREYYQHES